MARSFPVVRGLAVIGAASLVLTACGGEEPATTGAGTAPQAKGDGTLKVGTLLPETGSLAFLGPPEFAGVDLAIKEINAAGGVLGKPVVKQDSDSGDTSTNIASQSVDRLIADKVDAIVGAASSSVTLTVIDKITGSGVVQISPANTSITLTDYNDKGLYWRTAPPDVMQGRIVGDTALNDGNETLAILALQDAYGTSLADQAEKAFTAGGGQVVAKIIYDPKAATYSAEVGQVKAKNPDGIAMIGFDETSKFIEEFVKQGLLPLSKSKKKMYFVDGNLSNSYKVAAGTLEGVKGTLPGANPSEAFRKKLLGVDSKLEDFSYAAESYDATILVALAAEAAKDDAGTSIASKLGEVSKGGEKCTTYAACLEGVKAGRDIDYDGQSGPVEFDDKGNPTEATMGVYQYGRDNKYKPVDFISGKVSG
jgi:ABC-type branched-subunit amino acid transport system substrate-binding protein